MYRSIQFFMLIPNMLLFLTEDQLNSVNTWIWKIVCQLNIWHYFLSWKNQDVLFCFSQNIDKEILIFFLEVISILLERQAHDLCVLEKLELLVNIGHSRMMRKILIKSKGSLCWDLPLYIISRRKIFKKVSELICSLMRPRPFQSFIWY